ncbi:hypothetical protein [Leptodesmis sichuanensis]|uniref:hypothetical protein n=1 Tax=Leptodesmis sichuanensis TaxID=2906798 RepID=UPI001F3535F1|nr:hypothetical protein [Leptodesmis sichuanensis]UIE38395.1 hypothetical protein KIK02_01675 [Leptodesmis sichuanensis A121]
MELFDWSLDTPIKFYSGRSWKYLKGFILYRPLWDAFGFGFADNPEGQVQKLDAEPANGAVQRLRINLAPLQPELTNPLQQRC